MVNKVMKSINGIEKSLKTPFTLYAGLECLLIKQQSFQNNPNESYTERKAKHEPSGYALRLSSSFNSKEYKHNFYRAKDCIKRFCSDLKEFGTKIIYYEEKEIIPLADNENRSYEKQRKCHVRQKGFFMTKMKKGNLKHTKKLEFIVIIQENL